MFIIDISYIYKIQEGGDFMQRTAWFVYRPRRISDLRVPHFPEQEQPFEIVAEVCLSALDYENFTEDLLADRAFLDGRPTSSALPRNCILVFRRAASGGVLVEPDGAGFVKYAAYLADRVVRSYK